MKTFPETESTPSKRSGWRRLLRVCAYIVATLLSLGLIGFGTLVIINWHDEPLTAETRAWLTEPTNPVPDEQNAWLAMQAIVFTRQTGPEVGHRFVAAVAKVSPYEMDGLKPDASEEDLQQLMEQQSHRFDLEFGPRWEADPAIRHICWNNGDWKGSFARIRAQRKTIAALLQANRAILQRYYAAIALPGFFNLRSPDYDIHYAVGDNLGKISAAACLARMDLTLRMMDGERSAWKPLQEHLHYWIAQTTHSRSMIGLVLAIYQVNSSVDWAMDMWAQIPASHPVLLATLPDWKELASKSPGALLREPQSTDLRSFRDLMATARHRQSRSLFEHLITWLTYKPCATLNLSRHLVTASEASIRQSCDWTSRHMVYNFRGKILGCIAAGSMGTFRKRAQTTRDSATRMSRLLTANSASPQ